MSLKTALDLKFSFSSPMRFFNLLYKYLLILYALKCGVEGG